MRYPSGPRNGADSASQRWHLRLAGERERGRIDSLLAYLSGDWYSDLKKGSAKLIYAVLLSYAWREEQLASRPSTFGLP